MNPKTLQEAVIYFSDLDNCMKYMARKRWPDGVVTCPTCGRKDVSFLPTQRKWQCKSAHVKRQFSAKVGTIFEDSPIPLEKWIVVVWMVCGCKNGVSSYEIAKTIGVTQKSAWFMLHRIRLGMAKREFGNQTKIGGEGGEVEVDESWIGGKASNMHQDRRERYHSGAKHGKTIVMGMLDRSNREIRAKVVSNVDRETLQSEVLKNVKYGSKVYTDSAPKLCKLGRGVPPRRNAELPARFSVRKQLRASWTHKSKNVSGSRTKDRKAGLEFVAGVIRFAAEPVLR
jgi:hypothetical protein